jgi:hypothetical protein
MNHERHERREKAFTAMSPSIVAKSSSGLFVDLVLIEIRVVPPAFA